MRRTLVIVVVAAVAEQRHRCFTRPEDFDVGALNGRWSNRTGGGYDAAGVWRSTGDAVYASGNVSFGDLRCPLEGYTHACGSGLGVPPFNYSMVPVLAKDWADAPAPNGAGWRDDWLRNGELAWRKRLWEPARCDLPRFDGRALASALRGRTLRIDGDSTARQLFVAFACGIPRDLVAEYAPVWDNGKFGVRYRVGTGSSARLVDGSVVSYRAQRGVDPNLWRGPPPKRTNGAGPREIIVECTDLHEGAAKQKANVKSYAEKLLGADGPRRAEELAAHAWQISVQTSVQHFGHDTPGACAGDGAYTAEKQKLGGCKRCAEPNTHVQHEEERLAGLVATVTNAPLRDAADAHPRTFYTDCTHYCLPGPQDAIAAQLAAVIVEFGNATNFYERVTQSPYWRDRHAAMRAALAPAGAAGT